MKIMSFVGIIVVQQLVIYLLNFVIDWFLAEDVPVDGFNDRPLLNFEITNVISNGSCIGTCDSVSTHQVKPCLVDALIDSKFVTFLNRGFLVIL